ncbi:type II secretion system F family protein [Xinfangfangia sp. D13-10-4-6]|uniref:type II secretion system F family protein n=1 Tax=Pseudogemmobacter hezensis TaxID=2737662 RepID=UPI001556B717|nr:type II secretion system F family protein [Pseudogemmobacter hezensis]NPD17279.1 type II secretion system F family protein [Pseudogemmobacter hezensis]
MNLISSWILLGSFIGCAVLFVLALLRLQRAPAVPVAASEKPVADVPLVVADPEPGNSDLRRQLFQAGIRHPKAVRWYLYAKVGLAVFALLCAIILLGTVPRLQGLEPLERLGFQMILAVLGYFVPIMVVEKRRKAWLKRIEIALPDALDFMLICVEAGQSTDVSVMRVAEELAPVHPELSAGLVTLTESLAAGADRQEAWLRLAYETSNDDLRQLANIILQSSSMGTPVAQTLRVFSADLRDRRVRKIEERANVLPTKMTLGTMMFTVPPLLILLLAPAIYRIVSSF